MPCTTQPNNNRTPRYAPYRFRMERDPGPPDLPSTIIESSGMARGASHTVTAEEIDDSVEAMSRRSETSNRPTKRRKLTHKPKKFKTDSSKAEASGAPAQSSIHRTQHQKVPLARRNATSDLLSPLKERSTMQAKPSLARHDATLNVLVSSRLRNV